MRWLRIESEERAVRNCVFACHLTFLSTVQDNTKIMILDDKTSGLQLHEVDNILTRPITVTAYKFESSLYQEP